VTVVAPARVRRLPLGRLDLVVLALVLLVGLAHVPFPFTGDQAMFAAAARGMRHGDRLYVDFWDYKQPGVYLWYLAAGSLLGFRAAAMHLAELAWMLAFAVVLQITLRTRLAHAWTASVAPLATVGAYYAVARATDLTQVEALVALPLYLSVWSAVAAAEPSTGRRRTQLLVLSGVTAAVAAYLKLEYVAIPLAAWASAGVTLGRREGAAALRRAAMPLLGAAVVPVLPLLAYFAAHGLLGEMWWTFVVFPPQVLRIDPPPVSRLVDGVTWFVRSFAWLVVPAVAGIAAVRRDALARACAAWLVVAWVAVLTQHWWPYHFVLPMWPVGILAVFGVDHLWSERHRVRGLVATVAVVTALASLLPARELTHDARELAADRFALATADRQRFETAWVPASPRLRAAAAFLAGPGRAPGPVWVLGNPTIWLASGRDQAIAMNGWSPTELDARLWRRTHDELVATPPVYLFADDASARVARSRSAATWTFVSTSYCRVERVAGGWWYARRDLPECAAVRGG